jgi:hypothetical protein
LKVQFLAAAAYPEHECHTEDPEHEEFIAVDLFQDGLFDSATEGLFRTFIENSEMCTSEGHIE